MNCEHCNGTGSLSNDISGFLDCPYCNAAEERNALEHWYKEARKEHDTIDLLWLAFQRGLSCLKTDS